MEQALNRNKELLDNSREKTRNCTAFTEIHALKPIEQTA